MASTEDFIFDIIASKAKGKPVFFIAVILACVWDVLLAVKIATQKDK